MTLRTLGVEGRNLPTKKSKNVRAADFAIGGIVGRFERKYNKAFVCNNPTEFRDIFGEHVNPNFYGPDAVKAFFDNAVGVAAKVYVSSHVGHTGTALDATIAGANIPNTHPENVLKLDAAYLDEPEYGISGLRTGYTITLADRFVTAGNGAAAATVFSIVLDSVVGFRVGDIGKFVLTGGTGTTVFHTITAIDENTRKITWTDAQLDPAGTSSLLDNDVVSVPGFRLRIWRKNIAGVVTEVDEDLGKIICTTEAAVADFFVSNIWKQSRWIRCTRLTTSTSTAADMLPAAVSAVTYLTGGADGTAPTTAAHWAQALALFNNLPVRFLANPESSVAEIQDAMEVYSRARWDNPLVIRNLPGNQNKAQLLALGHNVQRSDDVLCDLVANWLKVTDPFSTSVIAVDREVPNVGHLMGMWIRSIGINGIHFIPAINANPIYGANGVVGDTFLDNRDRTDLAEAGINVIQDLAGAGIVLRNLFTASTTEEYLFANGLLMRNFIKVSVTDSLSDSENTPNSLNRINQDRVAIMAFYYDLWQKGSTGNVPSGETFGQYEDENGVASKPTDHFEVVADITNNPRPKINIGERNLDSWFTYPTPAGSIRIGVGFILK